MTIFINKKRGIKINSPVYRPNAETFMTRMIITLSAITVLLAVVCPIIFSQTKRIKIEVGTAIDAAEIMKDEKAYFGDDFDPDCVNHPGVYSFTVISGDKEKNIRLTVVDTKAPDVKTKDIKWPVGAPRAPKAEDFIDSVYEPNAFSGSFERPFAEFKSMGIYDAAVRFEDSAGNQTSVFEVKLSLVSDSESPKIELAKKKIEVRVGITAESLKAAVSEIVKISDNCAGELTLDIDDSAVNYGEVGEYSVYLVAKDLVGNRSERVSVTVNMLDSLGGKE